MKTKNKLILERLERDGEVIAGKYDAMFKNIMYSSKNISSLFISGPTKMNTDYIKNNLVYLNNEMIKNHYIDKLKITDILMRVEENLINLEMNTTGYLGDLEKDTEYAYNLVSNQRKMGDSYKHTRKTIQIRFDSKSMFKNDDREIIEFKMRDDTGYVVLDKNLIIYHINMEKIMELYYTNSELTRFEKAVVMLELTKKEELRKLAKGDEVLMEMERKLEEFSKNEDIIDTYDREYAEKKAMYINMMEARNEGKAEGIAEGEAKGLAEGERTEKINIARNMLNDNISIETIIKYTRLSEDEINQLKND